MVKRRLGTGHWDRKLKENLVQYSVADNYEEAKHEWVVTGRVFWGNRDFPSWVTQAHSEINHCLCGHTLVYHFEILNTENGNREVVGSEHVNSYMVLKHLSNELKRPIDEISDEEVEEWINAKITSMKAKAWMEQNGEYFNTILKDVKDIDLRINYKPQSRERVWKVNEESRTKYGTYLRGEWVYQSAPMKRAIGKQTDKHYQMASIIWRWNHPSNPKAQAITRGYPNDRLWSDMIIFHTFIDKHREQIERENKQLESLTQRALASILKQYNRRVQADIEWEKRQEERRKQRVQFEKEQAIIREKQRIENLKTQYIRRKELKHEIELKCSHPKFLDVCEYYGIKPYNSTYGVSNSDKNTLLRFIEHVLRQGHQLDIGEGRRVARILEKGQNVPSKLLKQYYLYLTDNESEEELDKLTEELEASGFQEPELLEMIEVELKKQSSSSPA